MQRILTRLAVAGFAAATLISTPAAPLTTPAFAQAHVYRNCASAADLKNKFHEPVPKYADGNGDGKADDYLMWEYKFKNTVLEEWCIDGGSNGGFYIAWKIDGTGKPFKFIGKCSWEGGLNWPGQISTTNGVLNAPLTITSKDPKSGRYWTYTYYPQFGSIVAQKHEADGTIIPPGASVYPKEEPFSYSDLLGDSDPTYCVDISHRRARQLPK